MEKTEILRADILDILFENRNKDYGAYELRKQYGRRMTRAVLAMVLICVMATMAGLFARKNNNGNHTLDVVTDVNLSKLKEPEPQPELPKQQPVVEQKIATEILTAPKITIDEEVKDEEVMKPVDDYEKVKISNFKQEGVEDVGVTTPVVEQGIKGIAAPVKQEPDYDVLFTTVEIAASFPGGIGEWRRFLERQLNADLPAENGAPSGVYTVVVSFIVNKLGQVSDVRAETNPGYGTKEEAIRVIQKGPNWIPAEQNGHKVIYRHKQSITFKVE